MPLTFEKISTKLYRDVDVYARAATVHGQRTHANNGFQPNATYAEVTSTNVHVYRRAEEPRKLPIYDNYHGPAASRTLSVTIARTLEDMMRVIVDSSAVYMAEQECPMTKNSTETIFRRLTSSAMSATSRRLVFAFAISRISQKSSGSPCGREFRKTRLAFQIVRAGIEFCRAKGYRRIYGSLQKRLLNFWGAFRLPAFEGGRNSFFPTSTTSRSCSTRRRTRKRSPSASIPTS